MLRLRYGTLQYSTVLHLFCVLLSSTARPFFVVQASMITYEPTYTVSNQFNRLVQITSRPLSDLLNDLIAGTLDQMFEDQDADLLADCCLDGVSYPTRAQAQAAANGYNAFNRALLREKGRFHVRTAFVQGDCTLEFTESVLLEA
jgi:hypothetical protein